MRRNEIIDAILNAIYDAIWNVIYNAIKRDFKRDFVILFHWCFIYFPLHQKPTLLNSKAWLELFN